jgi:hypothetical protein
MLVAVLQFDLLIHDSTSLKDKRRVVLSVKDRLHREHTASVAEVGFQDALNKARMGLAIVGGDARHLSQTLDRITAKLKSMTDAELGDASRQIIHGSELELGDALDDRAHVAAEAQLAEEMLRRAEEQ